jgi:AraC-like DNA-binding protein
MISFYDHGFGRFTPRRPIQPCRWDRSDLLCVHDGQLRLTIEQSEVVDLSADLCVLIYPMTRFEGRPTTESCRVSVQHFSMDPNVPPSRLPMPFRRLAGKRHGYEVRRLRQDSMVEHDIARAIRFAFERPCKQWHDLRVAQLTLILGQLEPTEDMHAVAGAGEQWQTLIDWLRRRLHEPLSIERMADYCGISASHFRVRFRQTFGQSPGRYLQRMRLQESQRLLRESDTAIKAIARQTGYHDLPNFYRAFRRHVGCTPADYRNRYILSG